MSSTINGNGSKPVSVPSTTSATPTSTAAKPATTGPATRPADSFVSAQAPMVSLQGAAGGFQLPAKPQMPGANASDQELMQYQEAMQKYNRLLTMMTQIQEMDHEAKKAIIQNLRA